VQFDTVSDSADDYMAEDNGIAVFVDKAHVALVSNATIELVQNQLQLQTRRT
jgi:Fe-S cluster assembly iron-binding protein IscA